ncbi:hypothetical protein D3C81_2252910 [compost metagenome]
MFQENRPEFQLAVTFDEVGDKTQVVFQIIFNTPSECNKVKVIAIDANEENFDKLEEELKKMV